jgi:Skp family chaperone for outer membrane proteins
LTNHEGHGRTEPSHGRHLAEQIELLLATWAALRGLRTLGRGRRLSHFEENRTVKRTAFLIAGALALGVAIVAGTVYAQGTRPATTPAPTTKVAVLNITYVMKHYVKTKTYMEEFKKAIEPYEGKDKAWKAEGEKLAKDRLDPKTTDSQREGIEKRIKQLQRSIEDNKVEVQKVLMKKQEEQIKILYNDVRDVVHKFAQQHGYEMVLHYHEPLTTEEYNSSQNIFRKMNVGAMVPMYVANGLDISVHIVQTLNGQAAARH